MKLKDAVGRKKIVGRYNTGQVQFVENFGGYGTETMWGFGVWGESIFGMNVKYQKLYLLK